MSQVDAYLDAANVAFNKGNYPLAEFYIQHVLHVESGHPQALALLGTIADKLGIPAAFSSARDEQEKRFILGKAWGHGFWSDMDHVLGQLLIADLTGRMPVTQWGNNSLFNDGDCDDAFVSFFEPLSPYGLADLQQDNFSYFPPKWSRHNLADNDVDKWEGAHSRLSGMYLLGRDETVVVSDYHNYLTELLHWVSPGHQYYGLDAQTVYRALFRKYIKLRPELVREHDQFWNDHMRGAPLLAVHVRGSDKIAEDPALHGINNSYHEYIEICLSRQAGTRIFLLTDSIAVLAEYSRRYGEKLIYTACYRSDNDIGVHHTSNLSRKQIAREAIRDAYLAARCDYFIGNGRSNVSTSVLHMKEWPPENFMLLNENFLFFQSQYKYHM